MKQTCPGCGFRTLPEQTYGSFDICDCGWEDDDVQLANPCSGGGANKDSLHDHQKKVIECFSIEKMAAFERDPEWRPLNKQEVAYFEAARSNEHWSFFGDTAPQSAYWRQNPNRAGLHH
jgi:hypothetical protein